ncbi:MAG: matrixin family metalloprotease [Vicinamibacterales bacterium]
MTRGLRLVMAAALVAVAAPVAHAYLKLGTEVGSRVVGVRWDRFPVRYFLTNRAVDGVSQEQLRTAVQAAFDEWASVRTANVTAQFVGFTDAEPFDDDGASVIGFQSRPEMDRTLGATTFTIDTTTGAILDSDIFFNASFAWSVAASGQASRFDLESIATHEIGHLFGLGHSALGETELIDTDRRRVTAKRAVMFPIAYPAGNIEDRSLKPDDRAGLTDIYGSAADRSYGSLSGRVTLDGAGLFGAHVTAFNTSTGELVSGFSLNDAGTFVITGLAPGLYVVRAEPLDDADIDSFFDEDTTVNIDFRPAYAPQLVAVPAGGAAGSFEIKVRAK